MSTAIRRVGDIATQIRGVTYQKQDASTSKIDGYLPVLRAGNITDDGLVFHDLVFVPAAKISPKQMVRKNDIVIAASSGSLDVVGKAARAMEDFDGGFGAFCKVLRPCNEVDAAYFAHFFKTLEYRRKISSLAAGANINNLRNEDLDDLEIPLPPLHEQNRIAGILDAAEELRVKRRECIDQLNAFLQSAFLAMFGDPVSNPMRWEVTTIGSHIRVLGGFAFKSSDFTEQGVPIVRISNLAGDSINLDNCARVPASALGRVARFKLQPGDTLIAMSGATTGKLGFVPDDLSEEWYLNQRVGAFRISNNSRVDRQYLRTLLQSSFYQRHVRNLAGGAAQPNISGTQLESAEIPLPPLDFQRRFAAIVESVERQKTRMRNHLVELDALFASLQTRAFNGEL